MRIAGHDCGCISTSDQEMGGLFAGLRPSDLSICDRNRGTLKARLLTVEHTIPQSMAVVDVSGEVLRAKWDNHSTALAGDEIGVSVNPSSILLFRRDTGERLRIAVSDC